MNATDIRAAAMSTTGAPRKGFGMSSSRILERIPARRTIAIVYPTAVPKPANTLWRKS